jgi:hypothetical protein
VIREPECTACNDAGWVSFTRNAGGKNYPSAAACHCVKGTMGSSVASQGVGTRGTEDEPACDSEASAATSGDRLREARQSGRAA